MSRHIALLRRTDVVVVAIDLQDTLLRVMHDSERLIVNARILLQAAQILDVPVISTTQNSGRLGGIHADLAAGVIIDKLAFSAAGSLGFLDALESTGRTQVVICGLETHICVVQTALDLIARDYQVHVAADAVSSRTLERHKLGMERIRDNGGLPIAAEGAVFEMLGEAGTPDFKKILPLVR